MGIGTPQRSATARASKRSSVHPFVQSLPFQSDVFNEFSVIDLTLFWKVTGMFQRLKTMFIHTCMHPYTHKHNFRNNTNIFLLYALFLASCTDMVSLSYSSIYSSKLGDIFALKPFSNGSIKSMYARTSESIH